jgi:hypothetical protein
LSKKTFQSRQFKTLRDEYYALLKEQGFEDIEDVDSPNEFLLQWTQETYREDKAEYFKMATDFFNQYPFANDKEKRIWEMHAEGMTIREISGAFLVHGYSVTNVHKIIKKLKTMMLYRFKP